MHQDSHLSDEELLLATDGELTAHRWGGARPHLEACRECRHRLAQLEAAMARFAAVYQAALDPQLPPPDGSAPRVRARLMSELPQPVNGTSQRFFDWKWAAAAFIILGILLLRQQFGSQAEGDIVPNPSLTPGETTLVSRSEVCQANSQAGQSQVSEALKQAVFREYGINNSPRDDYEVDFLITPELGGSTSIRNLWPQPYSSRAWNAHVKDALEERLHELVCSGDLDLATAQRELATNWVGAYKKYVRDSRPM